VVSELRAAARDTLKDLWATLRGDSWRETIARSFLTLIALVVIVSIPWAWLGVAALILLHGKYTQPRSPTVVESGGIRIIPGEKPGHWKVEHDSEGEVDHDHS